MDWLCFGLQHGLMDCSNLGRLLPAICNQPVTPPVRVAANAAACQRHGRAAGTFGCTPEMAGESLQNGFSFASAGTDISFFRSGFSRALAIARGGDLEQAGY